MMGNDRLLLQPTLSLVSPRMTSVKTTPRGETSVKGSPRGEFQKRFSEQSRTSTVTDSTLLNAMNKLEGASGEWQQHVMALTRSAWMTSRSGRHPGQMAAGMEGRC